MGHVKAKCRYCRGKTEYIMSGEHVATCGVCLKHARSAVCNGFKARGHLDGRELTLPEVMRDLRMIREMQARDSKK